MEGIIRCDANYSPLTPISFLKRAATFYPNKTSMIYGELSFTWKTTHQRCLKLASALSSFGLCYGDLVAVVASNIPQLYELHYGVPMAGGVLCPLNPRLDASTLSQLFFEQNPKFIFVDHLYIDLIQNALNNNKHNKLDTTNLPYLVLIHPLHHSNNHEQKIVRSPIISLSSCCISVLVYKELVDMGKLDFDPISPKDECHPIMVAYTSGSTGHPKGAVYSHRSAYLNTIEEIFRSDISREGVVFLWTADMFRANGWGFVWATAAVAGVNVCLTRGGSILEDIVKHGITHFSGSPAVLEAILDEKNKQEKEGVVIPHKVQAHIAGMLPPSHPHTLLKLQQMGIQAVPRYGMTEVLGPPLINLQSKYASGGSTTQSYSTNLIYNMMEDFDVKDPNTMESVAHDGKTIGEIMFRGNTIMMGYLNKTVGESKKVFEGGWFHTGDLAVRHINGDLELKDRAKDVILKKGVCISSFEIEAVLLDHPKVQEAAVVGVTHIVTCNNKATNDQGYEQEEAPCAFVKLKTGEEAKEEEIIKFCKSKLPKHMIPTAIIFGNLAVSSTGKVQKFVLRETAKLQVVSPYVVESTSTQQ